MRIEAIRIQNWGNTGPARIAPIPDSGVSPNRAAPVQAGPSVRLPYLRAFALPEVNAPEVDVQGFLSMTAALLDRMDQIKLWQAPSAGPIHLDLSA